MSFDAIISQLAQGSVESFGLIDMVVSLVFPAVLSIIIVYVYKKVQMHNSFSPSYLLSLFMLASLSGGVTLFIGDNVARAFGLIGAMSIIRFRNALKEPIDAVFVLWALATGMASGAGYYLAATVFTSIVACVALTINYLGLAEFNDGKSIIKITSESGAKILADIEQALYQHTSQFKLLHEIDSPANNTKTRVYTLMLKKHSNINDIEQQIESVRGASVSHSIYRPSVLVAE